MRDAANSTDGGANLDDEAFGRRRQDMVRVHIAGRGVKDPRVLRAMRTVRRERFVPTELAEFAYRDGPLPISVGQTISQPYIVAIMAEAAEIKGNDRVLEIGTGSGYGAAVLSLLASEVWTIERHEVLAAQARECLQNEGFDNVHVVEGDGTLGYPQAGPFDAIVVTAAGPDVPRALQDQLAEFGRIVLPVGAENGDQDLIRVRRSGDTFDEEDLGAVRFVPLIGAQGWEAGPSDELGDSTGQTKPNS
jgi:protein-L-isoaspartate(D-aspartate) O-methyltransferase